MKKWIIRIESIVLMMISVCLLIGKSSPNFIRFLQDQGEYIEWELYLNGVDQLLLIYCIIAFALCLVSFWLTFSDKFLLLVIWDSIKSIFLRLKSRFKSIFQGNLSVNEDVIWLLIAISIGIFIRVYYSSQPIRADEAYSFIKYANRDLDRLFFYELPNNHVLHNILVKFSTRILGISMFSLRFPALLAGIGLIPLVYAISRSLNNSGIFAASTVAVFPFLVFYSVNSRGYSLLTFITLLFILAGFILIQHEPSFFRSFIFSVLSALGLYTMPSMLYPIIGFYIWFFIYYSLKKISFKKIIGDFVLPAGFITFILSVILYSPVIFYSNGIEGIINNRYVHRDSWSVFLPGVKPHVLNTFQVLTRDIPIWILSLFLIFLVIGLVYYIRKRKEKTLLLLMLSFIFGSFFVFVVMSKIPFPRTWIFFIPIFCLLADEGYSAITENLSKITRSIFHLVIICGAAFYSLSLISSNSIAEYRETGYFPEAEIAVKYLESFTNEEDRVYIGSPATWPTHYYLVENNLPIRYYDWKDNSFRNVYYIVQESEYSIEQMTEEPVRKIFEYNDLSIYQLIK